MHYETYGVNIMKNIYKNIPLVSIIFSFLLIFIGCSNDTSNKESSENTDVATQQEIVDSSYIPKELLTVQDTIQASLWEAMERLLYFDNSGLYENEFSYYTDEHSFDKYLTYAQITYHAPGEVISLEVDSLEMFAHDSALAWVTIELKFAEDKIQEMTEQRLIVYYHNDKWIKPTISVIKNQLEYEDLIRQAEEASNWEDE